MEGTTSTTRHLVTAILQQLGRIDVEESTTTSYGAVTSNHPSILARLEGRAAEQAKSTLLTLHFLFPHELLPALDLLDRSLVKKFRCQTGSNESMALEVFYVQSASAVTEPVNRRSANSRFRNAWTATKVHYEVRLESWNCTCAAFSQSQLKLLLGREGRVEDEADTAFQTNGAAQVQSRFGGVATTVDSVVPICKHILAVIMVDAAPRLFGSSLETRDVSIQEMAAWSAGWGEG